jgi:hypothetical protein
LALQDAVDVAEDVGLTKGNSLFSEVDDRRLVVKGYNKFVSNHNKLNKLSKACFEYICWTF